jgi:hypothetical protein
MCRILNIGRSSYYAWKRRSKGMRDEENEVLVFKIKLVHGKPVVVPGLPLNCVHEASDAARIVLPVL